MENLKQLSESRPVELKVKMVFQYLADEAL